MPSLTIRNLEPETKEELRRRATSHGHSMQDEARKILKNVLVGRTSESGTNPSSDAAEQPLSGAELYRRIRAIVEPIGGIDIELPPRDFPRKPPSFD